MQITWTTETAAQTLSCKCPPEEQEVLVSYLPLSYLTAQLFDVWVSISVAGALYFAQPDALRVRQSSWVPCCGGCRDGWGGRPGGGVTPSRGGSPQHWHPHPVPRRWLCDLGPSPPCASVSPSVK